MVLSFSAIAVSAQTPVTFQYFYDDLGQLTKVVDSTGNVVEYVYDPVGNILQIKRSTSPAGALAIFSFTPQSGGIGQAVTIQGQGFSTNAGSNVIQFNGVAATIVSASANTLVALVPQGSTTGPISVKVGTQTASSSNNFTVIPVPVITSLSRKSALFNTTIPSLQVTGFNLTAATFDFQPSFSVPAITVTSTSINPSGNAATLSLQTATQAGTFALVATNSFGSSSSFPAKSNRFTVVDPRSTADSTGSGIPDAIKAAFGADPLDPNSIPPILPTPEAESLTVAVLNGAAPPHASPTAMETDSLTVSLLNGSAPFVVNNTREADSLTVSLLNGASPTLVTGTMKEADSLTVALLNGTTPPSPATKSLEADSLTVSLLNGTSPTQVTPTAIEADSLTVSLLNGTAPPLPNKPLLEADSLTVSLLNGTTPPRSTVTLNEVNSLTVALINGIAPPAQPRTFEANSLTLSLSNSAPKTGNQTPATKPQFALNHRQQNLHVPLKKSSSAKPKSRRRTQQNEGD